jgi:hypothetical protein
LWSEQLGCQQVTESEGLDIVEGSAPSRAGNQGLDSVEGSAPSEMDEEPIHVFSIRRAGNVGAPAIPGVMTPRWKEKLWMVVMHLD